MTAVEYPLLVEKGFRRITRYVSIFNEHAGGENINLLGESRRIKGFHENCIGELEYVLTNVHRNEFAFISAKSIILVERTKRRRIYIARTQYQAARKEKGRRKGKGHDRESRFSVLS